MYKQRLSNRRPAALESAVLAIGSCPAGVGRGNDEDSRGPLDRRAAKRARGCTALLYGYC